MVERKTYGEWMSLKEYPSDFSQSIPTPKQVADLSSDEDKRASGIFCHTRAGYQSNKDHGYEARKMAFLYGVIYERLRFKGGIDKADS